MIRRSLISGLVVLAVGVSGAQAGQYKVNACGTSDISLNAINNSWVGTATHPTFLNVTAACNVNPAPGSGLTGLYATDVLGSPDTPQGARAEWRFTAAPNTTLDQMTISRALETMIDDAWSAYVRTDTVTLDECHTGPGLARCTIGNNATIPASPMTQTYALNNATWTGIGVNCLPNQFGACLNGASQHDAAAVLRQATVTVNDATAPVVSGVSGPLSQSGVWVRGTLGLNASASDVGGGVGALHLRVDGVPRTGAGAVAITCDYTQTRPCNLTASGSMSLDTTALLDGTHTVNVEAQDAGGGLANSGDWGIWPIQVDNHAPTAPQAVALTQTAVTGQPLVVGFTNPSQGVASPLATVKWQLVPLDGGNDGLSGQGDVAAIAAGQVTGPTVNRQGRWELRLWYVDTAGNEDPASRAVVIVDTTAPPAPTNVSASATAQGAFTALFTVPARPAGAAAVQSADWQMCLVGGACQTGTVAISGPNQYQATGQLPASGSYTFTVSATDTTGRTGPQATSPAFTYTAGTGGGTQVDTDGDGFIDSVDQCPTVAGTLNGCPVTAPPSDVDHDGVPDSIDRCPANPGPASNQGCPLTPPPPPPAGAVDTDRDGVLDSLDRCPTVFGAVNYAGCPPPSTTTPPVVRSNRITIIGRVRYITALRVVRVRITSATYQRTIQVRVKKGTRATKLRLVRIPAGATRIQIPVAVAYRVPTRLQWRTTTTTAWATKVIYR